MEKVYTIVITKFKDDIWSHLRALQDFASDVIDIKKSL